MVDKPLRNCFMDGRPVIDWLAEQKDKKLVAQARAVLQEEVHLPAVEGRLERALPKMIRARFNVGHVMTGRAVCYNDRLIRRAKGTMSKPYPTLLENCLDIIFRRAAEIPLTNSKLADLMERKPGDVSSIVGRFRQYVPDVITMDGNKPPRIYRLLKTMTVEEAYKLYIDALTKARTDRAAARKGQYIPGVMEERIGPALVPPQEIKVTVEVAGSISILFGFKKE